MGQLYFAYGSNLNLRQMKWRCPKARKVGPLMLPDHRLTFRGCADIEPSPGDECPGGVWELTPACERVLDRYEGVHSGLYVKRFVPVEVSRGPERVTEDMLVYMMGRTDYVSMPSRWYFDEVRKGYHAFDLDEEDLWNALARVSIALEPEGDN